MMKKAIILSLVIFIGFSPVIFPAPKAEAVNFFQRIADSHATRQCAFFGVNCAPSTPDNVSNTFTYTDSFNNNSTNTTNVYGTNTNPNPNPTPVSGNRAPVWSFSGDRTVNVNQTLNLVVNATDADHDWLYYDAMNVPAGAYFDRSTHTMYWTPSPNQVGNHYVQFTVTDNYNAAIYQTVNIVVVGNQSNRAPVWNLVGDKNINVGQSLQFSVFASDPDGNSISYSVTNLPSGASFDTSSRNFFWTPSQGQTGSYIVSFRASDGTQSSDMGVRIIVSSGSNGTSNFNAPRFFGFNPGTVAVVNQLYVYDSNATDPDGDSISYSLISAPSGMSINAGTGFIAWVPVSSQIGTHTVRVAASDGSNQGTADFTISVIASGTPAPTPTPVTPAPTEARLVISDIRIENKDGDILISWKTNIPSGSRVIYDTTSQADRTRNFTYANATRDDLEFFANHQVNLGKLDKNLVYYLRVVSKTDLQTATGQEIGFIQLENGEVQSFFGANLLNILGDLFGNTSFLWLVIAGLGTWGFLLYRKGRKSSLTI